MVIPKINEVTVYLGAAGVAYTGIQVFDRIEKDGSGYLAFGIVDVPYLLSTIKNAGELKGFLISEEDTVKKLGPSGTKLKVMKVYALMPQGLVPAYIVSYSDELGGHTRVVDASTGEVLYSSDGGLGSAFPAPYLTLDVLTMAGIITAAAVGVGVAVMFRRRRGS